MSKVQMNLQDSFLNAARRQNVPVTIALNDGTKLKGRVNGFDNFTVILDVNKIHYLIYKHAIATIFPDRPLDRNQIGIALGNNVSAPVTAEKKEERNVTPDDLEKFKAAMEKK